MASLKARIEEMEGMDDFDLTLNQDENGQNITIEYYNGDSEEIIVPASFNGIPVTAVNSFFSLRSREKVKKIILPEGLASIDSYTFHDCINLTGITLPDSLTSIGRYAFAGCEQLTKIMLPKGLVDIGCDVFSDCSSLSEIIVDENNPIYASDKGVLFDKNMTTLVKYPQGRKGDYTIPDTVVEMGDNAFNSCKEVTRVTFPPGLIDNENLFGCEQLTEIIVNENNPEFSSIDGVLFDKDGKNLFIYPPGKDNSDYHIPDKVVKIWFSAFNECKNLTNIIFPEGLINIRSSAFNGCEGLTAITLPMSLQYIGKRAFNGCSNLETITLSRKTKTGYKAFEGFSGQLVYWD